MFWKRVLLTMILALSLFNIKVLVSAARPPLTVMESELGKTEGSVSKDRAPVINSGPNPCTYIPVPDNGDSGCHKDP
ncbi:hypothetical protein CMV_017880 [Castanea mollissima]|uniref:Uncharacterized protein n=1 Tax=Castanea mollissima TaxID=60419 RepID=A0A8J4QSD4_9ROSI|nr:hypothetical protein CMV_017880 [Castanea mollissima]